MNITQKGIVLVLFPLVLQLVVVCFLLQQLHMFNEARLQEMQAKRAVAMALELGFFSASSGGALYMSLTMPTPNKEFLSLYRDGRKMEEDKNNELRPIVKKRFPHDRLLKVFEKRYAENCQMQDEFIAELSSGSENRIPALLRYGTRFFAQMLRALDDVDRMSTSYSQEADKQSNVVAELWANEKLIIWGGIAASIVLTVIMSQFFSRSVTRRIALVKSNTQLLAAGKPLSPAIKGTDEISRLDFFFHEMADRLAAAAQFKRDFYAMISHDLRNPLASIKMILEMVSMGTFGELEGSGEESIENGLVDLDQVLALINDILDLEKLEAGQMPLVLEQVDLPELLRKAVRTVEVLNPAYSCKASSSEGNMILPADRERLERALVAFLAGACAQAEDGAVSALLEPCDCVMRTRITFKVASMSPASSSSAIGLRLGRMVVELHGGEVVLLESEDGGRCIELRLPERGSANAAAST